jgi:hypothetical protein
MGWPAHPAWTSCPEVHKVPEPANLVRRKYLKISVLAENFDQNPRIENTETILSGLNTTQYCRIFSVHIIFREMFHSHRKFTVHIILVENFLQSLALQTNHCKYSVHIILTEDFTRICT